MLRQSYSVCPAQVLLGVWGFYASCVFSCSCQVFHSRTSNPCLNMDAFTTVPPYSILIKDPKEVPPSNGFLLEKLTVPQLANKFLVFHGTRPSRTVFFANVGIYPYPELITHLHFVPILSMNRA